MFFSFHMFHMFVRLLKEAAEDVHYRKRYQLLLGALLSVVGQAVRHEFSKQEDLSKMLSSIAEKVKAARDKEVRLVSVVRTMPKDKSECGKIFIA